MLTIYPRHTKPCTAKLTAKGLSPADRRLHRKCGCPIWIMGIDPHGAYIRHALDTTSWQVAERRKQNLELGTPETPKMPIADALDAWKSALLAAKRRTRTVAQVHGAMAGSLAKWAAHEGLTYLDELTLDALDRWIATWQYASTTHRGRIDLTRAFFRFCISRKWLTENPAIGIIKPEEDLQPTLPFTTDEEARIFAAAETFGARRHFGGIWSTHPETARAYLLIMRWTGLRASDTILFDPARIRTIDLDGRQVHVYGTYQMKTSEWVDCPIPPEVAAAIAAAPHLSDAGLFIPPRYSRTDPRTIANSLHSGYLKPLSTLSGVTNIHAHRFRDTFAVRLLEAGRPLEIVQMLLGHNSIKTTEKHYSPWVKSRREMLVREVIALWHPVNP